MPVGVKAFVASTIIVATYLVQSAATAIGQVVVPPELSDATEFVNLLQQAGVVVQDVRPDTAIKTLFEDTKQAVHVLTNLGAVEVAIFNGEMDAESITVMYHKGDDPRWLHGYDFYRPKGNKVGWTTSSGPLYFTMHHKWFIQTLSAQLDSLIKQALGQANALNR
jgi:hypothetical protein